MPDHAFSPQVMELLERLQQKYGHMGQDLASYLEGLLYSDYINYWDYIHLETLLSLQTPRTRIPDEEIFIMYHQITELYFKLCLHEYRLMGEDPAPSAKMLITRIGRINRYFENLIDSFDVMVDGMDPKEFLKFRMALMPASGFQSVQYRKIEICSTDLRNLTDKARREALGQQSTHEEMFGCIYWKEGATEAATGAKTLTLLQFEEKYAAELMQHAREYQHKNVWAVYRLLSAEEQQNAKLLNHLKELDSNINVNWPLMHYKSAVRYLQRDPEVIAATGGTNWQKYLPPKFQKRIFFPDIWTQEEKDNWGKGWVNDIVGEVD
jgi:tryptophan 2,3-dioxygenase